MKPIIHLSILILATSSFCFSCKTTFQKSKEEAAKTDTIHIHTSKNGIQLAIDVKKGESFNHPTFVVWMEDLQGEIIHTLYITNSYATGEFGHAQLSDSTWSNTSGASHQPAALPYWNHKKGLINGTAMVPTKQNPYVDAHSSATPKNNFQLIGGIQNQASPFRLLLEVNQTWDWNRYWTNGKYPENRDYKNSAQPSLIYAVVISKLQDRRIYHLNPIGHGHPSGDNGDLFTDLSTLTTAKNIFSSITVKLQNP